MISNHLLDSLENLRLPILDDVSLVQDAVVPLDAAEELDVLPHDVVGRHDEVVVFDVLSQALPFVRNAHVLQRLQEF